MSEFINRSKHAAGSAAVENHFFNSNNKESIGEASGKQFQRGMTPAWDTRPVGSEAGQMDTAPSGAPPGPSLWNDNIASQKLPKETGVNYTPRTQAGHGTESDKPFATARDGFPGSSGKKLLWD